MGQRYKKNKNNYVNLKVSSKENLCVLCVIEHEDKNEAPEKLVKLQKKHDRMCEWQKERIRQGF